MRAAAISRRTPNPRLVKRHRSYTVEEAARLLGVHKNSIREWIRRGLPVVDHCRPCLILGRDLVAFLEQRRRQNKRPCLPGQIYCVRCRQPQFPAGGMADYQAVTPATGNLVGLCPACDGLIYRRVSLTRLQQDRGDLDVRLAQAARHIDESDSPSVNCDFKRE